MAEPFIAQITLFAGTFAPVNYALCQGQVLSISQNTALFSLIGTLYGGNGQTTFALPDLRGRVPIGAGTGPGLPTITNGEQGGTSTTTLLVSNLPAHNHSATATLNASNQAANDTIPTGAFLAEGNQYRTASNTTMAPGAVSVTIGATGNNVPFSNMQPYLGMSYIIALFGNFPVAKLNGLVGRRSSRPGFSQFPLRSAVMPERRSRSLEQQ